jgi:hypothetical protein
MESLMDDAVLREKPWVSGFRQKGELDVYAATKQERLAELHHGLQDAIAARKGTESEILMVDNMARNDLASDSVDAGLPRAEFEVEAKAIESKAGAPIEAPKMEGRTQPTASALDGDAAYQAELREIDARFNKRVEEILSGSAA